MAPPLSTLALVWILLAVTASAQGGDPPEPPFDPGGWLNGGDDGEEAPESPDAKPDASSAEYQRALDLQRRGKWKAAQKAFRDLLDKFPDSVAQGERRGALGRQRVPRLRASSTRADRPSAGSTSP